MMLFLAADMRRADAETIAAGTPGAVLMERAGAAVAECATTMIGPTARVLVLCGPGNNGGDGFVAARLLAEAGHSVELFCVLPPDRLKGDAAEAGGRWSGATRSLEEAEFDGADLVVDALFGTGLGRDLDGPAAATIHRLNAAGRPVLAVDVPSGIDSDSGVVRGVAVQATRTIALAARKPGHLLYPGWTHCGETEVAEIGIPEAILAGCASPVWANGPDLWRSDLPAVDLEGHKYGRGHALVVSGPPAHTGAARLAARGALRAGAGLVSVVTSARALAVNAAHLTAIMLRVCDDPDELSDLLSDDRFNALALGPALGVGEGTRAWVAAALEADRATVLDADALTSFSGEAAALAAMIGSEREHPVVVTPHAGEFARLFDGDAEVLAGRSKLERTQRAAARLGAIVLLKGPDTVVAAPDGRAAINENGSAHLATAGSGDVLGGIVCGLMAQGMPGFEAACVGVWMHADAATRFGRGLIAEDLPELLPEVWEGLEAD